MNANEIVRDLRKWGRVLRENHRGFNPEWQAMFAAASIIESLQADLTASQRRERAAVEFIQHLDREYSHYISDRGFEQWRGPEDARKGEAE